MAKSDIGIDSVNRICASILPSETLEPLLQNLNGEGFECHFRHVFTENDWYRVGGIVNADGIRLTDNLENWLETRFNGDIADFQARYGDCEYRVTSFSGKTHYLCAAEGAGTLEFIQLEIEEIHEVVDHDLINHDNLPDSLEEILDPLNPSQSLSEPIAPSQYVCKNVTRLSALAEDLTSEFAGDPNFRRFVDEWERSSASDHVAFHDCWAVVVLPLLRAVGEHKFKVKLLSPFSDQIHAYDMSGRGVAGHILNMINKVDKESGFPMAWYFLLITKKYMSHGLVTSIRQELGWKAQKFIAFADADREIFENWIDDPYWL